MERKRRKRLEQMAAERAQQPNSEVVRTPQRPTPKPVVRDYNYPPSQVKDKYRIDVLAPLYLHDLVQDGKVVNKFKIPDKVLPSLKFYEGLSLAVDTLKKMGYKFDIYVYDVSDELESVATLVNTDAMVGSDLIIGILSSNDFPRIANHVKKYNVNFVSALSPSNYKIAGNPYFTMIQPTLETHCAAIEEQVYNKHGNIMPLLMYRTDIDVDNTALGNFVTNNAIEYDKLNCNKMPSRDEIAPFLNKDGKNVIVMPILSYGYAERILVSLSQWFPDYDLEVWGMPSWGEMPALKKRDAFPNIAVYYTSPFYFDPTTASGLAVMNAYRKKFGGIADDMVFRGYETMVWYAYLLKKYGNIFNERLWDSGGAPFTRYKIEPVKDNEGELMYYENKHTYLYRYQGGSFMVEQ